MTTPMSSTSDGVTRPLRRIALAAPFVVLAIGIAPRLSAAALAGLLVPTTVAGHAFWNEADAAARGQQRIQFFKNLCMLGGPLEVALSGPRRRKESP